MKCRLTRVPFESAVPHEHDRPSVDLQAVAIRDRGEVALPLLIVEILQAAFTAATEISDVEARCQRPRAVPRQVLPQYLRGRVVEQRHLESTAVRSRNKATG